MDLLIYILLLLGAYHLSDTAYIFRRPLFVPGYMQHFTLDVTDLKVADQYADYVVNFVRNG